MYINDATKEQITYESLQIMYPYSSLPADGSHKIMDWHFILGASSVPTYDQEIEKLVVVDPTKVDGKYYSTRSVVALTGPEITEQLAVFQTTQKEVIKVAFDAEVLTGFTTTFAIHMDLDPTLLSSGINLATALSEPTMRIRDFYNDVHVLPLADVQAIIAELSVEWRRLWNSKVDLQESIKISTTISEIESVIWVN